MYLQTQTWSLDRYISSPFAEMPTHTNRLDTLVFLPSFFHHHRPTIPIPIPALSTLSSGFNQNPGCFRSCTVPAQACWSMISIHQQWSFPLWIAVNPIFFVTVESIVSTRQSQGEIWCARPVKLTPPVCSRAIPPLWRMGLTLEKVDREAGKHQFVHTRSKTYDCAWSVWMQCLQTVWT